MHAYLRDTGQKKYLDEFMFDQAVFWSIMFVERKTPSRGNKLL